MKLFDRIKYLLELSPIFRNSDNELKWKIWVEDGTVVNGVIDKERFMKAIDSETIRRTRQKVCEQHPELKADENILKLREEKEKTGGNFVYQEKVEVSLPLLKQQLQDLRDKWTGKIPNCMDKNYFQFRADKLKAEKLKKDIEAEEQALIFTT